MNNYEILKQSPVFHMSLHSKELFHSNFLAWLGEDPELRPVFRNVMEALGVSRDYINTWGDDFEILREKFNFDLLVKGPDTFKTISKGKNKGLSVSNNDGQYYLVIENKIKSIPTQEQLKRYSAKLEDEKVRLNPGFLKILLSIVKYDGTLPSDWMSASYTQIIEGLEKPLPGGISEYKKDIIMDYTRMLKALVDILKSVKVEKDELYLPDNVVNEVRCKLADIRIDDLYDKWRMALIANLVTKETGVKCFGGYTRKTPFLETEAVYFDGNDKEGDYGRIQLQGDQYRRCIATITDRSKLSDTFAGFLYSTAAQFRDKVLAEHNKDGEILLESKPRSDFNAFGEKEERPFWYQYVKISPDATIEQIAKCIAEDFKKLEKFKKVSEK